MRQIIVPICLRVLSYSFLLAELLCVALRQLVIRIATAEGCARSLLKTDATRVRAIHFFSNDHCWRIRCVKMEDWPQAGQRTRNIHNPDCDGL